jgi:hypothetical protein
MLKQCNAREREREREDYFRAPHALQWQGLLVAEEKIMVLFVSLIKSLALLFSPLLHRHLSNIF